jgi:RNA polymerase sigma-70 factor (ECF subfamily)
VSTAQDLPGLYGEPLTVPPAASPALRLVPSQPLDFDDAVRRVRPRLHRYAIRRLGDAHEAEELVQEALLRAYTHRDQLHTEEDLSAWSTVVTGRLVIDRLRVRGRSTSVADVPEGSRVGRDTADVVVARDEARTALDALDAMPSRQASLLWAREVEGKSYEELCQQFSMTEPAVRSVLTRARKALRREYELRGGTVPVGGLAVLAPWIAGLTWADKLRKCANRITAPAVLGAAGIAALGGLVLSPFGSDGGHNGRTFTPSQAVVASVVAPAHPVAASTAAHRAAVRATGGAGATKRTAAATRTTVVRQTVHAVTSPLGCTKTSTGPLADPTHVSGAWFGNQDCHNDSTRVGISVPVAGYDGASVDLAGIDCPSLPTIPASSPLTCSEDSQ